VFSQARLNHSFLLVPRKVWMDMAGSPSGGPRVAPGVGSPAVVQRVGQGRTLEKFDDAIDK